MTLDRKQAQIQQSTLVGLFSLAAALLAGAARSIAADREWITERSAMSGLLLGIWIAGMAAFGIAFGWAWLVGRRLDPAEKRALGDEFQVLMSRNAAVSAFAVTFVAAVAFIAVPGSAGLPGDAVASILAAVGAGTVAVHRMWDLR